MVPSPVAVLFCVLGGLALATALPAGAAKPTSADELMIVHCSLPGQIRQLGQRTTYVSARRPVRTTAFDCRVRGGEYVVQDRANLKTALSVWLEAANAGNAEAQTTLGEIFEQGLGVAPDHAAAAGWYQRAAQQGYTRALINLGYLYEAGLGVAKDAVRALGLYRQAAGLPESVQYEFTPDVAPVATLQTREVAALRAQVQALREETSRLQDDLGAARASLTAREAQVETESGAAAALRDLVARLEAAIAQRDSDIERLAQQLIAQSEVAADQTRAESELTAQRQQMLAEQSARQALDQENQALKQTVEQQLQALQSREQALQARVQEAEQLLSELELLKQQQSRAATPDPAVIADRVMSGPSIVLVDPELPTTRGLVKVSLGAPTATRKIIGRVSAPAGLLALAVNAQPAKPNAAGVFSYDLATDRAVTDVSITAIDNQGKRANLDFQVLQQSAPPATPHLPEVELGRFHALLIGNSRYQNLPRLTTPENDVDRLEAILAGRYGFAVTVLKDATRYEILSALNDLRGRLTSEDNLLIYYAGHGELDSANMRGHWLPVDAEPASTANWVSNVTITDVVNVMNARQVMLVVDSCYSGTLTRSSIAQIEGGLTDAERDTWLKVLAGKRARVVLTSGGLAPVLDVGGGRHSVFAKGLIGVLETNADLLTGRSLYQAVAARVAHAASQYGFEQIPQYAPIARAGHESGDFFLLPRGR